MEKVKIWKKRTQRNQQTHTVIRSHTVIFWCLILFTIVLNGKLLFNTAPSTSIIKDDFSLNNFGINSAPTINFDNYAIQTNQSFLYYRTGTFGPSFENLTIQNMECDSIQSLINYTIRINSTYVYMPTMTTEQVKNINLTDAYWFAWDLIEPLYFIIPNQLLTDNITEITDYILNGGYFSQDANLNLSFTSESINITGTDAGLIYNIYMEFDLETGVMLEYYFNDTMTMDSMVLIDSTLNIPFLDSSSIFNVERNQSFTFSSNLTNAGDFVSYRIQYWGKYYADNKTNHFVLAEEQFFQNFTLVTTHWYQMGFWIENSSISLDQTMFLPNYMNLTSLENQLDEISDPANYVTFNLSDYAINITYSLGFESYYYYNYYHYIDLAGIVIQNFMVGTENAYDYWILINSSEFFDDPFFSEIGIYPGDKLYYLERYQSGNLNTTVIQFRAFEITNIIIFNNKMFYFGNVLVGRNLENLTQIANNSVLGIVSYDPLRNEEPIYLNQFNLEYLGELAVDAEIYISSYPIFVPRSRNFSLYENLLANSSFNPNVQSYEFLETESNTIFTRYFTSQSEYCDLFTKSADGLVNYWYIISYSLSTQGKQIISSTFEVCLYAVNDLNNSYNYLNNTEWGISIGDNLIWYYYNSTFPEGELELTQIYDIFLMPSGYYLIFGTKYTLQAGSIEWMPALPLFDIGNNVSIPADILGIYGNGLLPCLHSPEVRPSYMFRDWSEAYYGMIKAYQIWEGSFDLSEDFYYDNNKIEILFRDSSTQNVSRVLNILYNENGILQDYMDIHYDSNGNISSWERKVLISGPGSLGEYFGNTTGGIPLNLTYFPFINKSSSDNSTISDNTTNTENPFFGDIPPAVYAGVGFLALLGAGTTIIVKKK